MNNFCVNTYDCSLPIESMIFSEGIGASSKEVEEYEFEVNDDKNDQSFFLASKVEIPLSFGSCNFSIDGKYLRGHWILLRGELSCQSVCEWSGLWMRVDGEKSSEHHLGFDNMSNRSLRGTVRSKTGFIPMFVPKNAEKIQIGLILWGTGKIQCKELQLFTSKAPRSRGELFKKIPADCYGIIVDYLDSISDFLSFSMVCRYTRNALFLNTGKSYYQLKFRIKDVSFLLKNCYEHERKFGFVEFISMNFNDVTLSNLKKLKEIFPNLHTLQMVEIGSKIFSPPPWDDIEPRRSRVIKHKNFEFLEKIPKMMFPRIIDPEQSHFFEFLKSIISYGFMGFREKTNGWRKKNMYGGHDEKDFPKLPIETLVEYVKNESSSKYRKSETLFCSLIYKLFILKDTKKAVDNFEKLLATYYSSWFCSAYALYLEWVVGDDKNLVRIEKLHIDASQLDIGNFRYGNGKYYLSNRFNALHTIPSHEGFTKYKETGKNVLSRFNFLNGSVFLCTYRVLYADFISRKIKNAEYEKWIRVETNTEAILT